MLRMLCARCVYSILMLCMLAMAAPAFADGHTLSGTVYGGSSALPNTVVEALNAGTTTVAASTTTDGAGHYALVLTDGPYNLHVTPPAGSGFVEATTPITMNGADQTSDVILLAPASGGGAVSGVVRGLNNQPLANVSVNIYSSQNGNYLGGATTDANGAYSITAASSQVHIYLSGAWWSPSAYAPSNWNLQRYNINVHGPTTADFNLPVVSVSGFVKGKDGASLASASVSASSNGYDAATNSYYNSSNSTSSDASGSYSMLITDGSGGLSANPPNDGYWPVSESYTFSGNTTHDLILDVRQNSTISGTIRGLGGNAIPNVNINAYSSTTGQYLGGATTDANGYFSMSAANGSVNVYMNGAWWSPSPYAPSNWNLQRYNIAVNGPTTIDVTLPIATVSGFVKGKDGASLSGSGVSGSSNGSDGATNTYFNSSNSTTSAGDGSYSLMVLEGAGGLSASAPNDGYWSASESYTFIGATTHDLLLDVRQNSMVSGTVRGLQNNPLANVQINVYSSQTGQYLGGAQTDSNGYYSLNAANGQIHLYLSGAWWNPSPYAPSNWNLQRYNVDVSGPKTIDFDLPIAMVNGIANDSNGIGVPNVSVSGSTNGSDGTTNSYFNSSSSATTASDGTYTLMLTRGSGGFSVTPPQQSGFTSASVGLTLNGDLTQRIILQHPDLIPPQIVAGPVVVHLSATSVSVSWTTNEASNSRVEFGLGSLSQTATDSALVTKHEVTLQGLSLNSIYQFRVGSSDAAGNGPAYSSNDTFTTALVADATPPRFVSGPTVAFVDQTSAIIQWETDEPATTNLAYGLGQGLGSTLNGDASRFTVSHSMRITGLAAQTSYYAQATSADPDGNAASSSIFSFTTLATPDITAPIITSGPGFTTKTDTKLTIVWTTDEPSTSGVSYNDGTHFDLVNDATLTRNHEITISGLTPSTTYNIRVSSTDANGNGPTLSDTIPATTAATPDTTAPTISDVTISEVTPTSAVISWTTNEPANSRVRFGQNAGAPDNTSADVDVVMQHEITLTGLAESKTYYFTVSSTDASGNTASSIEANFTTGTSHVDQAPSAPGPLVAPNLTNASSVGITWGASIDDVAVAKYEVIRDGQVVATLPSSDTRYSDSVGEGSFTYQVRATDSAGHTATSESITVVVDRTPPQINASDVRAEATGPQTAVSYNVDAVCSPASGSSFGVGSTAVTCTAADAAGNIGHATFNVIVTDTKAPCINAPTSASKEATSSAGAAVSYTASAKDLVDGAVGVTCSPASGSTFKVGNTTVDCTATDAAGNKATKSFTVSVTDTIAPSVQVPAPMMLEATSSKGAAATFIAKATDIVSGMFAATCAPASGSTFALGNTTVNCFAIDAAGNRGSASFSITVRDTTKPSMTLPKDITAEAASAKGTVVPYVASATDVVSGNIAPVCAPASGSLFPIGTTTVKCTAKDTAGNEASGSFNVKVQDTTAPAIASVTPSQSMLWPPDHKLAAMTVAVSAKDVVDAGAQCRVSKIVSSEVVDGLGDGDTSPDWVVGSGLSFQLRAERAAKGPGRIYTVTVDCSDKAGNHSTKSATVTVPKSQK